MKYVKNFNNNAALVADKTGHEWVVLGTGVGFSKQPGEEIPESLISRKFRAESKTHDGADQRINQLASFDATITDLTLTVVNQAEQALGVTFSQYQYLILADHINFAYQRATKKIMLSDHATQWELSRLFPKEYQVARAAVMTMGAELGMIFPPDEAIFLTYHFLSVEDEKSDLQETVVITKLISDVINIVQLHYQMTLDAESFNYSRFVSHLRYFFIRIMKHDAVDNPQLDASLLTLIKTKYPREFRTVQTIDKFLMNAHGWQLTDNDQIYLTLHVWRVTHRETTLE